MSNIKIGINNLDNNININNNDRLNPCRCPKCYLIPSITIYE